MPLDPIVRVDDRVWIPETIARVQPRVDVRPDMRDARVEPQLPEPRRILPVAVVVKQHLDRVRQLCSVALHRLLGKILEQALFLLRGKRAGICPVHPGQLHDRHCQHLLLPARAGVQQVRHEGCRADAERDRQQKHNSCFPHRDPALFPKSPARQQHQQHEKRVQPVVPQAHHEEGAQYKPCLPTPRSQKRRRVIQQLVQVQHQHQQGDRKQRVLRAAQDIHRNHRKESQENQRCDPEPAAHAVPFQKVHHVRKAKRRDAHLQDHIAGDPKVVGACHLVHRRHDTAEQQHMQQRVMVRKTARQHFVDLILRIIHEKTGVGRQKDGQPAQQKHRHDSQICPLRIARSDLPIPAHRIHTAPYFPENHRERDRKTSDAHDPSDIAKDNELRAVEIRSHRHARRERARQKQREQIGAQISPVHTVHPQSDQDGQPDPRGEQENAVCQIDLLPGKPHQPGQRIDTQKGNRAG